MSGFGRWLQTGHVSVVGQIINSKLTCIVHDDNDDSDFDDDDDDQKSPG